MERWRGIGDVEERVFFNILSINLSIWNYRRRVVDNVWSDNILVTGILQPFKHRSDVTVIYDIRHQNNLLLLPGVRILEDFDNGIEFEWPRGEDIYHRQPRRGA